VKYWSFMPSTFRRSAAAALFEGLYQWFTSMMPLATSGNSATNLNDEAAPPSTEKIAIALTPCWRIVRTSSAYSL